MKRIKNLLKTVILVFILVLLCFNKNVYAEGSKDLVENGGYRANIEWMTISSFGIERKQKLYVYAQDGETIYFGDSHINSDYMKDNTKNIKVTSPSGLETYYDVKDDKASGQIGYINTYEKEKAGPNINGSNPAGYTPLVLKITQTGIYEFEFYPSAYGNANPGKVRVYNDNGFCSTQKSTVGAWDITVQKADGAIQEGRVFTYYLSLNIGGNINNVALNAIVYVLTKDGYCYKTDFNGIDPYGFIFFSNNRGLVNSITNTSLYHSVRGFDNNLKLGEYATTNNAKINLNSIVVPLPYNSDTAVDTTHRIFFNQPASDLPSSIPTTAKTPGIASNFTFSGNAESTGISGVGGIFQFDVTTNGSYQIEIRRTGEDNLLRILSSTCEKGTNTLYWDGKDSAGNEISSGEFVATLKIKGGEYHFPLIDPENNPNGIKITLMNPPNDRTSNLSTIYYDNSNYTIENKLMAVEKSENAAFAAGSGNVPVPVNALSGVDSSTGALKFKNLYGDVMIFDVWTYFSGESSLTFNFNLIDSDTEEKQGYITGLVFYDQNNNGVYNIDQGEYALKQAEVSLVDETGAIIATHTTNDLGTYTFLAPYGNYTVMVSRPGYACTTNNESQGVSLDKAHVTATDVGYYIALDISTTVSVSKPEFIETEVATFTVTATNNSAISASKVLVKVPLPDNTNYQAYDIAVGDYDWQTGTWSIDNLAPNETQTLVITAQVLKEGEYKITSVISCLESETTYENNNSEAPYKVILKPDTGEEEIPPVDDKTELYDRAVDFKYLYGFTDERAGIISAGDKYTYYSEDNPYDSGTYYPVIRQEVSTFVDRLLYQRGMQNVNFIAPDEGTYSDLENGYWSYIALEYMTSLGIYKSDLVEINKKSEMTYGEVAYVLVEAMGIDKASDEIQNIDLSSTGISENHPYLSYMKAMVAKGYYSADIKPDDIMTRIEFLTIFNKIIKRQMTTIIAQDGTTILFENALPTDEFINNYQKYSFKTEMPEITADNMELIEVVRACHSFRYSEDGKTGVIVDQYEGERVPLEQQKISPWDVTNEIFAKLKEAFYALI